MVLFSENSQDFQFLPNFCLKKAFAYGKSGFPYKKSLTLRFGNGSFIRLIGKRVQIPCSPAAVSPVISPVYSFFRKRHCLDQASQTGRQGRCGDEPEDLPPFHQILNYLHLYPFEERVGDNSYNFARSALQHGSSRVAAAVGIVLPVVCLHASRRSANSCRTDSCHRHRNGFSC